MIGYSFFEKIKSPVTRAVQCSAPFILVVAIMCGLTLFGLHLISTGRSVIASESVWSQKQKNAVYFLQLYNQTQNVAFYQQFKDELTVPLHASQAKKSLDETIPNRLEAELHLMAMGLPRTEVHRLIWLYTNFKHHSFLRPSVDQWKISISLLESLNDLGESVRKSVESGKHKNTSELEFENKIKSKTQQLQVAAIKFSEKMDSSISNIQKIFTWFVWAEFLVLFALGFFILFQILKNSWQTEQTVIRNQLRWRTAVEGTNDAIWDIDLKNKTILLSKRWFLQLGKPEPETDFSEESFDDFFSKIHPEEKEQIQTKLNSYLDQPRDTLDFQCRYRHANGSYLWLKNRMSVVEFDDKNIPSRVIGISTDINDRHRQDETMQQLAYFDHLTQLPNRTLLARLLEQETSLVSSYGSSFAFISIDLDRFKDINDDVGQHLGDQVLLQISQRLKAQIAPQDTIARVGGDEFRLILRNTGSQAQVTKQVTALMSVLDAPLEIDHHLLHVRASAGSVLCPHDAESCDDLQNHVETALQQAKMLGGNRHESFDLKLQNLARTRRLLTNDLRSAISRDELFLVYQPIVNAKTGKIIKAEVLMRWKHAKRGLVIPAEFIPLAESSGIILSIGQWLVEQVAKDLHTLRTEISPNFQISINKSPRQFLNDVKLKHSSEAQILNQHAGQNLCVEITESMLMEASDAVKNQFMQLRDLGVHVSLDDFGTGYSSLAYLQKFDIDQIKIDRSFVKNLQWGNNDHALCEAMIVMAHKLNMKVIGEGVETDLQHDILLAAGCDFIQGFLYSPGLPLPEFLNWTKQQADPSTAKPIKPAGAEILI